MWAACTRTTFLFALAAAAAGCESALPPTRIDAFGVAIHDDAPRAYSSELCAEIARFRDAVRADLGAPGSERVEVATFADPAGAVVACGANAFATSACAEGDLTVSTLVLDQHELVHAFTLPLGQPPAFFSEGLAEVYSCRLPYSRSPRTVDPALLVSTRTFDALAGGETEAAAHGVYTEAASFVGYLLDTVGGPAFLSFFERAPGETDLAALDALAASTLGVTISDALAAWSSLPVTRAYTQCRRLLECTAAPLALGTSTPLLLARGVSRGSGGAAGALRTVTLTERSTVRVMLTAAGGTFEVGSCDRGPVSVNGYGTVVAGGLATLEAGRYYVWVTGTLASEDEATLEATLELDATPAP